jgi:lipopolysaccharide cholinephosphotransferase
MGPLKVATTSDQFFGLKSVKMQKPDFDTLFPDERERGETTLRQCQLVMLRMLKICDYLCAKHSVEYFLTGGTLLGAVRHQGFIPWDDDLDIGMTRDNYEKFLELVVPELPKDIFFQNSQTDPTYPTCGYVEARLRDKYSSYPKKNTPKERYHEGLLVDIFVYDKAFLPSNFFIILQNKFLTLFSSDQKRARVLKRMTKLTFLPFVYASSYISRFGMMKMGTYVLEKELQSLVKAKFEDMEAYIPSGWNSYLERQYKNFYQLPPVEQRKSNHTSGDLPDPFTPCEHQQVLFWKNKISNGK